jgi:hypothetical protein
MQVGAVPAKGSASPTPLLDRLAPLPAPEAPGAGARVLVAGLIALVLAVLASWRVLDPSFARPLAAWGREHLLQKLEADGSGTGLVLATGSALAAVLAVIFVHEAGHVAGGLCAGFRFHSMALGPLKLDRSLRLSRHRGPLAWSGGWVGMAPARRDRLRLRAMVLVMAGPAANLICGCAVLLAPFTKGLAAEVFVLSSIAAGLIELLPIRSGAVTFDGWKVLRLVSDREWTGRWLASLALAADLQRGVRPEDLPAGDLAKAVALRDASADTVSAHALAYSAAFHQHADAEAARLLEICLQHAGHAAPALRQGLMSEAAVFQARRRKRLDLAEAWLSALPAATELPWQRTRAEAAVLEARGDLQGASSKLDEYEGMLRSVPLASEAQRAALLSIVRRWKSELLA